MEPDGRNQIVWPLPSCSAGFPDISAQKLFCLFWVRTSQSKSACFAGAFAFELAGRKPVPPLPCQGVPSGVKSVRVRIRAARPPVRGPCRPQHWGYALSLPSPAAGRAPRPAAPSVTLSCPFPGSAPDCLPAEPCGLSGQGLQACFRMPAPQLHSKGHVSLNLFAAYPVLELGSYKRLGFRGASPCGPRPAGAGHQQKGGQADPQPRQHAQQ